MNKYKLLSSNLYCQVRGGWFPHWGLHIPSYFTGRSVITQQLPSLATAGWREQLRARPGSLQVQKGSCWNWLLLSSGLIHASRVHRRGFIPSVGFGSAPAPHPGLGQSLRAALRGVGIPVVVCSVGLTWRDNGNQIKMNSVELACFLPSFVLLLLFLCLILKANSASSVLWQYTNFILLFSLKEVSRKSEYSERSLTWRAVLPLRCFS